MSHFLEQEKSQQTAYKFNSSTIPTVARADGVYKGKARPFCLPREHAEENLFPGIRQSALDYFAAQRIHWHDGQNAKPSNHLCDSQVC